MSNSVIKCIPQDVRPTSLKDAYAIRDRFIKVLGADTCGWFGACTNDVIQELLGLDEPYYAYLLSEHVYESPAKIDTKNYPPIVFECEFAFVVDRDFVPAGYPYSRETIENSIIRVCPAIEIVAGHLENWPQQDVFSVIADNGTDGALVVGEGVENWQEIDLVHTEVTLTINGEIERQGSGKNVLGDPLGAFVWLVNAITRDGKNVFAGQVQNTGTATDIYWAQPGDIAKADFGSIGAVDLTLV
ncbi:MAG: fumarylacetoacetate hydrolase family protein [Gammaproteobacteria bacterium]|nr:fumarylacetoacetate hydrolase family protein [Gammaproteobacteria bacterium]